MSRARNAAAVLATAFLLRPLITAVPPAMSAIREDLGLSEAVAGLTVGLPLVCFGAFAFATPALMRRFGARHTMTLALVIMTLGAVIRPAGAVPALVAGTVGIGVGAALGNVLIPVMIRRISPFQVPRFMAYYTVILAIGATAGSLFTGPLLARGLSWNAILLGWAGVSAVVAAAWVAATRGPEPPPHPGAHVPGRPTTLREIVRLPHAWAVMALIGTQSLLFYSAATWLPTQLQSVGFDVAQASIGLALYTGVGIGGAFLGPRLVGARHGRLVWGVQSAGYAVGLLLVLVGGPVTWLAVCLIGLGQGTSFATALTMIAQTSNPLHVGALSAFAQGIGYLLASLGPSGFGALHTATDSWLVVQVVMASLVTSAALLGLRLMRPAPPDAR